MIYLEPTPYILGLADRIAARWPTEVSGIFIHENLSQKWNEKLTATMSVLPPGRKDALQVLLHIITKENCRLLHLAGWGHPLLLAALILARLRGIPVTMESDTPLPVELPSWKRAIKRLLYPIIFRLPAMFLPGGTRQAVYLRHYGVATERIVVAQMTVDTTEISAHVDAMNTKQRADARSHHHLAEDAIVFLYVGRLEPQKGLQELIGAFRRFSAQEKTLVQLLLVGDGSLRELIAEASNREAHIRYAGRLFGEALMDVYGLADVFVLPSRFEPWGLVVNEAMAAGLPVIASDRVGCVDDLVMQNDTGLIVASGSEDALVDAMASLMRNKSMRDRMAHNARALIAGWSLENEAKIVLCAWEKVLES
jgi:glycosyltransferase involved in cell wall biosynthesis